jgi:hypothetical protein
VNFQSIIAGFIGGIICSTIYFLVKRAKLLPALLRSEKVRDLSYYGRGSRKKKISIRRLRKHN